MSMQQVYSDLGIRPPLNLPTTRSSFLQMPDGSKKKITSPGAVTLDLMLPSVGVKERIDAFLMFCEMFSGRDDPVIKNNLPMFSHRLLWQEHPYVEKISAMSYPEAVELTFIYSFCVEYWPIIENGKNFVLTGKKFKRNDLFQVWYPKGVTLRTFILEVSKFLAINFISTIRPKSKEIMEECNYLLGLVSCKYGFRFAGYAIKNALRYLSFVFDDVLNPESYVTPGTGSYRGLHQIFGGKYLGIGGSKQKKLTLEMFDQLMSSGADKYFTKCRLINLEDKVCFFFKHLSVSSGWQSPVPGIPYTDIFPSNFCILSGKYNRLEQI